MRSKEGGRRVEINIYSEIEGNLLFRGQRLIAERIGRSMAWLAIITRVGILYLCRQQHLRMTGL